MLVLPAGTSVLLRTFCTQYIEAGRERTLSTCTTLDLPVIISARPLNEFLDTRPRSQRPSTKPRITSKTFLASSRSVNTSSRLRRSALSRSSTKREAAKASVSKSGSPDRFDQCNDGTEGEPAALKE